MKSVKENKQICSLIILENKERHGFLTFGEEVSVGLPIGVITLKELSNTRYVVANSKIDEVDIKQSLANKNFQLGYVEGRFYSPELMPILEKNKKSYGLKSDGSITKLLSMVEAKRIDGALGVYLEMAEYERLHPQGPKMQFMRIKEAPEFSALTASCEKTPWGQKAIKAISKVIREKNFKDISNQYLMSALPAERRKEYQKIYDSRPTVAESPIKE
jgi:uncharacterized protein (TIGR02285 family)